jgi:hypothetical protein
MPTRYWASILINHEQQQKPINQPENPSNPSQHLSLPNVSIIHTPLAIPYCALATVHDRNTRTFDMDASLAKAQCPQRITSLSRASQPKEKRQPVRPHLRHYCRWLSTFIAHTTRGESQRPPRVYLGRRSRLLDAKLRNFVVSNG